MSGIAHRAVELANCGRGNIEGHVYLDEEFQHRLLNPTCEADESLIKIYQFALELQTAVVIALVPGKSEEIDSTRPDGDWWTTNKC